MSSPKTKKSVHLAMISAEYNAAIKKHPKFCDRLINPKTDWSWLELSQKHVNDTASTYYGENILLEEVAEAFNAYSQGKLEVSLQEFAQCGAVILRCMQYVRDEINGGKK